MREAIPTSFEIDLNASINAIKTPLAGYQDKINANKFNIYIENYEFALNNNN